MLSHKALIATLVAAATASTVSLLTVSGSQADTAQAGTIASATWDASTDHSPQLYNGETSPRGQFTFNQVEDAANLNDVTVNGTVTGLRPRSNYTTVLYVDPFCAPTPSVTAFPSAVFTTDANGNATLRNLNLNPQSLNALRTFDIDQTRSISIRDVLLPGQTLGGLPVTVPTVPNPAETEACDANPFVN